MIILIADSICGGFGQRDKKSFVHLAAEKLNICIWDQSATGMSSSAYLNYLDTGTPICPEQQRPLSNLDNISVVVIALGNVDGKKSYKNNNLLGLLVPSRYRKEKIDPRPYFSKRLWKLGIEKIDNLGRHFFRYVALFSGNLKSNICPTKTKENISRIINLFHDKKIILISTSITDKFYFPGATKNFSTINKFLEEQSKDDITFFDIRSRLKYSDLLDDRFHLNAQGHKTLEIEFSKLLEKMYKKI